MIEVTAYEANEDISAAKLSTHWNKVIPKIKGYEVYPLFIVRGEELNKLERDMDVPFDSDAEYGIAKDQIFRLPSSLQFEINRENFNLHN